MFLHALTRAVSNRTRSKGLAYFVSGAVIDLSGDASSVQATVRGTRDYGVRVTRQGSRFTASCQCPYFEDRAEICKHIWAVLEAADRRNLLGGQDDPPGRATLVPDAGLPG